jgi:hypothetical protein
MRYKGVQKTKNKNPYTCRRISSILLGDKGPPPNTFTPHAFFYRNCCLSAGTAFIFTSQMRRKTAHHVWSLPPTSICAEVKNGRFIRFLCTSIFWNSGGSIFGGGGGVRIPPILACSLFYDRTLKWRLCYFRVPRLLHALHNSVSNDFHATYRFSLFVSGKRFESFRREANNATEGESCHVSVVIYIPYGTLCVA